ncbi:MAG: host attachment protein [Proteobacteria bacterium]|nr:host attachment protein [Pseudomonadota bacterium]
MDTARARLFVLTRDQAPDGLHEELVERVDLVEPSAHIPEHERYSQSQPGGERSGGLHFGLDDHRAAHNENVLQVFSRSIVASVRVLVTSSHASRLIVCGTSKMIGELRAVGWDLGAIEIREVPKHMTELTPTQLREHLVARGVLPEREQVSVGA